VRRALPYVALVLASVAVLLPLLGSPRDDSFPLSTYPMFARDPGEFTVISTVVAEDRRGVTHRLSPSLIGGSPEPVLAAETARQAVQRGRTAALCDEVADRIAESTAEDLVRVQVVTETHDLDQTDDAERTTVLVHDRCRVPR
jgi:hypothetical protein